MTQVLRFRSTPSGREKLFSTLGYLFFGGLLANSTHTPQSVLTLFFIAGVLVWAFVLRKKRETSYFLRYHLAEALLLNGLLVLAFWLITAILEFFVLFPVVGAYAELAITTLFLPLFANIPFSIAGLIVVALNLYTWLWMLLDKTTDLPVVSENARHWA